VTPGPTGTTPGGTPASHPADPPAPETARTAPTAGTARRAKPARPAPAEPPPAGAARRLRLAMAVVALLAAVAAGLGAGVRSTYGGRAAVDEPQYLLSALSLYEDGDLDIADELADRRYLAFHDADLPVQTSVRPDGSQLSPHDPLLPVLLAVPMGAGGWLAAKLTLAGLAGVLAALLLWVAVRRFAVPLPLAATGTALAATTAPLAVYGQQVYPELPGALAALAAVAAITAPRPTRTTLAVTAAAVTALPWLSVKYVPVGAALTAVALGGVPRVFGGGSRRAVPAPASGRRLSPRRDDTGVDPAAPAPTPRARDSQGRRSHPPRSPEYALVRPTGRQRAALVAVLAAAGAAYLGVHRLLWGGWTAYASGDHFESSGEFGVVGFQPDYAGRTTRLLGLLVDRDFGLAAWQPAWLLLVPALAALVATRPRHWAALTLPLAAGWATATWLALTMHGYWWPGRQLVVVLPLAVLAILGWLTDRPRARVAAAVLATAGVAYYVVLLAAGTPWVLAPDRLGLHPPAGLLLPDDRDLTALDRAEYALWLAAAAATALTGLRTARRAGRAPAASRM